METKSKNQPQLEIKAIIAEKNKFSFSLWNYPNYSYFLDKIKLNWVVENNNKSRYFDTKIININKWINGPDYEFKISYFELEPTDFLWEKVKEGKDLRDMMKLEVVIYYQDKENHKKRVRQQVL
ncbi:MAG: hypothetical protein ACE5WD_09665 [Candidatus Aminicenantia bacterium]